MARTPGIIPQCPQLKMLWKGMKRTKKEDVCRGGCFPEDPLVIRGPIHQSYAWSVPEGTPYTYSILPKSGGEYTEHFLVLIKC